MILLQTSLILRASFGNSNRLLSQVQQTVESASASFTHEPDRSGAPTVEFTFFAYPLIGLRNLIHGSLQPLPQDRILLRMKASLMEHLQAYLSVTLMALCSGIAIALEDRGALIGILPPALFLLYSVALFRWRASKLLQIFQQQLALIASGRLEGSGGTAVTMQRSVHKSEMHENFFLTGIMLAISLIILISWIVTE
ncbi:MAG: hypothetical protein HS115_11425 [Spirochaetales bacterium]|nr:hypothetical protein [Spirochaetales bacterium]